MPVLVHLAPASSLAAIRKNGIRQSIAGRWPAGVFCMPVTRDYFVSHQWLRELKRGGQRTFVAVRFRLGSDEPVLVGHYGTEPIPMRLGDAIRLVMEAPDARGYQLLVPRKVTAKEITGVAPVHRVTGWRYSPDAKGQRSCPCPVCLRGGEIKSARRKERLVPPEERGKKGKKPSARKLLLSLGRLRSATGIIEAVRKLASLRRSDSSEIAFLVDNPEPSVQEEVAFALEKYGDDASLELLRRLARSPHGAVRSAAAFVLIRRQREGALAFLEGLPPTPEVTEEVEAFRGRAK